MLITGNILYNDFPYIWSIKFYRRMVWLGSVESGRLFVSSFEKIQLTALDTS